MEHLEEIAIDSKFVLGEMSLFLGSESVVPRFEYNKRSKDSPVVFLGLNDNETEFFLRAEGIGANNRRFRFIRRD